MAWLKKAREKWISACLSIRRPQEAEISSSVNRVIKIQRGCANQSSEKMHDDHGYNHVLVMIDHFTKYAEAAPCMTASAEETCDPLINVWIARHGCPITFQSDNGKAFVGNLTEELTKRLQVAQAQSPTNEWPV